MNNLSEILKKENAASVFFGNNLDELLYKIENECLSLVPDTSTAKGRKEISSLAYRVSKSKTAIDAAGKTLVSEWKEKAKLVDLSRKHSRDFLDNLRDEVRKPLTAWENEEKIRHEQAKIKKETESAYKEAVILNDLFDREKAIAKKELIAAEKQAEELRVREEKRLKIEKEEQAKIEIEIAEINAKIEAEQKAQVKINEAKIQQAEAMEAVEKLKREAVEAKYRERLNLEKVERDRLQAAKDAAIAIELAQTEAQEQAKLEAERIEQERINTEAEKKRKSNSLAADRNHRLKINNESLSCLVVNGIDKQIAIDVIKFIVQRKIDHISIKY